MTEKSSLSKVTRGDRAIYEEAWITDLLLRAPTGALATAVHLDDEAGPQPFLATLLFVYVPERRVIYIHKARRGRVWDNLQANPRVCFTVSEMGRLLPAAQAMNFSVEFTSVVVFGTAKLVENAAEAEEALQKMLDKYFPQQRPGQDYRPITAQERDVTAVYRIEISEWSGKKKEVAEDFPGAFRYPDR